MQDGGGIPALSERGTCRMEVEFLPLARFVQLIVFKEKLISEMAVFQRLGFALVGIFGACDPAWISLSWQRVEQDERASIHVRRVSWLSTITLNDDVRPSVSGEVGQMVVGCRKLASVRNLLTGHRVVAVRRRLKRIG